jgi:hypothetical protein
MPCEYYTPQEEAEIAHKSLRKIQAMLCGICTSMEKDGSMEVTLSLVDWKEAGVSRYEFEAWWSEHKDKDKARRLQEHHEKKRQKNIDKALRKLTPAERRILGLNK